MARILKQVLFIVVFGALVPLVMLEGIFRLLPVASPPPLQPINEKNPVARFEPNRDYTYAAGWNFPIRSRKHSNNYGFNHVADYNPAATPPLFAVIGDSFVEGHEVDAGKTAAELLHTSLAGDGRVYSFGISGAPLSQYLAYADWARETFRPQGLAIVVIGNDFDESLLKYKQEPRLHYFAANGVLMRIDYELSGAKHLLRESAFLRYMQHHLLLGHKIDAWRRRISGIEGLDYEQTQLTRIPDSKKAVDYFLEQLPRRSGLEPAAIELVLDAERPAIYSDASLERSRTSYFNRMRAYLKEQALARGFEIVDLEPVFIERHRRDGRRFEFTTDKHWNELGQRVVADEIGRSAAFRRVFAREGFTAVTAPAR